MLKQFIEKKERINVLPLDNLLYFFGMAILTKKRIEGFPNTAEEMVKASENVKQAGQEIIDFVCNLEVQSLTDFATLLRSEIEGRRIQRKRMIDMKQDYTLVRKNLKLNDHQEGYNSALTDILALLDK